MKSAIKPPHLPGETPSGLMSGYLRQRFRGLTQHEDNRGSLTLITVMETQSVTVMQTHTHTHCRLVAWYKRHRDWGQIQGFRIGNLYWITKNLDQSICISVKVKIKALTELQYLWPPHGVSATPVTPGWTPSLLMKFCPLRSHGAGGTGEWTKV